MTYSRGDIILVNFPDSNLRTYKLRPALIVQADELDSRLSQRIVATITSNLSRAGHPSRVLLTTDSPDWAESGLLTASVIMTDNLATVLLTEISRKIGALPMHNIDSALRHTLGL